MLATTTGESGRDTTAARTASTGSEKAVPYRLKHCCNPSTTVVRTVITNLNGLKSLSCDCPSGPRAAAEGLHFLFQADITWSSEKIQRALGISWHATLHTLQPSPALRHKPNWQPAGGGQGSPPSFAPAGKRISPGTRRRAITSDSSLSRLGYVRQRRTLRQLHSRAAHSKGFLSLSPVHIVVRTLLIPSFTFIRSTRDSSGDTMQSEHT